MQALRFSRVFTLLAVGLLAACSAVSTEDAADQNAAASAAPVQRVLATVKLTSFREQIQSLRSRDYDIAGVDLTRNEVVLVVDSSEVDALRSQGFQVVDVQQPDSIAPADLNGYVRPDTLATALHGYADRFPTLAAVSSIGRSLEGRDILAVHITKDVNAPQAAAKPAILFNGMHHARELMTAEVELDTVDYLLTHYGTDPKVTHWVDANDIWVVPMLNVDGNNRVWTNDHYWRKNARGCPASGSCPSGTGVDINRNYPFAWGTCNGSSTDSSADDYRGPSAASEPETQALMALVGRIRPVFDISYHSFSELVLYPQGCDGVYAPNRAVFEDIGKKMASGLPSDDGTHTYQAGTPWELLYSVDGDDIDWMLHEYSVMAFGIELSSSRAGFQPSYSQWRDKTVAKARASWQILLDRLDGSAIRGFVRTGAGFAAGAQVDISPTTASNANQSRVVNADGTFHAVLLPGDYQVTITAAGHDPVARRVTVGDARVDLDFAL